jgi:hypothetical protein
MTWTAPEQRIPSLLRLRWHYLDLDICANIQSWPTRNIGRGDPNCNVVNGSPWTLSLMMMRKCSVRHCLPSTMENFVLLCSAVGNSVLLTLAVDDHASSPREALCLET